MLVRPGEDTFIDLLHAGHHTTDGKLISDGVSPRHQACA